MSGKTKKLPRKPKKVCAVLSAELVDFLDKQALEEKKSRAALLKELIEISIARRRVDRSPPVRTIRTDGPSARPWRTFW